MKHLDPAPPEDQPGLAYLPGGTSVDLEPLRCSRQLQGAFGTGGVWLSWPSLEPWALKFLKSLPRCEFYLPQNDQTWKQVGDRLPKTLSLPPSFQPIASLIPLGFPAANYGITSTQKVTLRLKPSRRERSSQVLLTTLQDLEQFASSAPSFRLDPLRFAVSGAGEALVLGEPVPSIPGKRFYANHGIAVVSGWQLSPIDDTSLVRDLLELAPGDLALIEPELCETSASSTEVPLRVTLVPAAVFVSLTRSAVRETIKGLTGSETDSRGSSLSL